MNGKVKWFDKNKGFGFITGENGLDYFVHYSSINQDGFRKLYVNQKVSFDDQESERGKFAVNVTVMTAAT